MNPISRLIAAARELRLQREANWNYKLSQFETKGLIPPDSHALKSARNEFDRACKAFLEENQHL